MSDKDPREGGERPKVKITYRRRVRADEGATSAAATGVAPGSPEGAGSRQSEELELAAARREAAEYLDHLLRLQAEFDNYRKRVLKEQTRAVEMAAEPLVAKLLEVLDDFELALIAAEQKPDFDKFLRGVELVFAKLVDGLRAEGLERIDAEGKPFDPELHEALMGSGEGDGEPVVADVFRQGYKLKGRVIRPAGVRVSHGS